MDEFHGKIAGPVRIEQDVRLHGMITQGASIAPGVELIVHGMITGDLIIEPGAKAVVHGMVNGVVRNEGGEVIIWGTVEDIIGPATVKAGAVIRSQER